MTSTRLEPISWIKAAFRSLTKGGPQAIRVEAIARDLKVSKGSFYWHFKDVSALKSAMIEHWRNLATNAIIQQLDQAQKPASCKLKMLVNIATDSSNELYGGKLVEAAVRDWGRYDPYVAAAIREVDRQRIEFVCGLFEEIGAPKKAALQKASILYGGLIGLELLDHQGLANAAKELSSLLELLLAK